jgi:hypothetical protein
MWLNLLAAILLLLNAAGAFYGGLNFMLHPDGSSLRITVEWLRYSPFNNYLIPGILLFVINGLGSLVALGALLIRMRHYESFVVTEGILLSGWIVVQVLMLRSVQSLHVMYFMFGVLIFACGVALMRQSHSRLFS